MRYILLIFTFVTFSVFSQIEEVRRITQTLCSKEFHGRGYVNQGDSIAAEYIAKEFKKIGLKPLKGKKYFQSFQFNVNAFPGKMNVQIGSKKLIPGIHFLVDPSSARGFTTLKPKSISIQTALSKDLLIQSINEIRESKEYNSVALEFQNASKDTIKLLAGIANQIAEILPVIEISNKKLTWSVAQNQLKYPYLIVQDSVYQSNQEWKIEIDAHLIESHNARNVIGYLKGTGGKNAKTLVFSAHYDHLGQMGLDTYFPGANDNASGTAILISMAKYFKDFPIDCNIIFMAFAGEEIGLLGSKYFVENPLVNLDKISFLVNLDIMGSGEDGITVVNATKFEKEFDELVKINEDKQLLKQIKKRGPAANSDHYWFSEKGVPSFFIYTMGLNNNYHDIFDTYEALSFQEYEDITRLLVRFVSMFSHSKM